jgi:hypothetical protein
MKIPDDFRYVLCPMKRHNNAKELVKKGVYIIDGIGDDSKILTSIDECLDCKYQSVIRAGVEYEWFPDWGCFYISQIRNYDSDKKDKMVNIIKFRSTGRKVTPYLAQVNIGGKQQKRPTNLMIRNSKGRTVKECMLNNPSDLTRAEHYIPKKLR